VILLVIYFIQKLYKDQTGEITKSIKMVCL